MLGWIAMFVPFLAWKILAMKILDSRVLLVITGSLTGATYTQAATADQKDKSGNLVLCNFYVFTAPKNRSGITAG